MASPGEKNDAPRRFFPSRGVWPLERERAELPAHVANYQRELTVTPQANRERRERLEWQIRRVEKRMAQIEARLRGACT
jgi:hypothetical protein